jgi:TolB-like protein/Tfp pilus assembly protein PilF
MSFLVELKRRNVIRMAGLYLVGAWLITQVAATVLPMFGAPEWIARSVVLLLAIGLVPALVVAWVFELTPEGLKRDAEVVPELSIAPQTARRMDRMLLLMMALALGYFALDKFVLAPERDRVRTATSTTSPAPKQRSAIATPERAPIDPKSIAVLAFANMSAEKDNEYFSDGVAEEILNALAQVRDLKVAGRTSSFYFKGRNEPLAAIGATLGVAHVLEGSVRKQGERLRITAQLIRVSDGFHLWSETFDGNDADIFALQENIARRVTRELKVALNAGQQDRLVDVGTDDPEAYARYLRGTDVFNRRDVANLGEAIDGLKQALLIDPQFARAHSRLATLYYIAATTSASERFEELSSLAARHAEQALQLNPGLAEPHAVTGVLLANQRRLREGRSASQRALQIDPNDPTANLWDALLHCNTGLIERCAAGLDHTLEIDPLLPNALGWRARLLVSSGEVDKAERMILRAQEAGLRWPGNTWQWIALKRGDIDAARARANEVNAVFAVGLAEEAAAAFSGAFVGDAEAMKASARIIDDYLATEPARINTTVPLTLIRMGQIERGLTVFADHPTSNEALFLGEVMGTRLHPQVWASPAFPEFLRKSGIAAHWDEFGAPASCAKDAAGDYRCK